MDDIQKAIQNSINLQREHLSQSLDANLEKGKKANIGEIRTHGGKKMQKTADGWIPYVERKSKTNKESKVDIEHGVNMLLQVRTPQSGTFIGGYDLSKDYKNWKEEVVEDFEGEEQKNIKETLKHFEKNVKAETIDDYLLLTDDEADEEKEIDEKFDMETPYSVSKLKGLDIEVPKGMSHFTLLPSDSGSVEIHIAFMTDEGKKYYGNKLTGDY